MNEPKIAKSAHSFYSVFFEPRLIPRYLYGIVVISQCSNPLQPLFFVLFRLNGGVRDVSERSSRSTLFWYVTASFSRAAKVLNNIAGLVNDYATLPGVDRCSLPIPL